MPAANPTARRRESGRFVKEKNADERAQIRRRADPRRALVDVHSNFRCGICERAADELAEKGEGFAWTLR